MNSISNSNGIIPSISLPILHDSGTGESGKTTIIKQMKILHIQGFTDEERQGKVIEIRRNAFESIKDITRHMSLLDPPVELADRENEKFIQVIQSIDPSAVTFTEEEYDAASLLWSDSGVLECFRRSNEYHLIDCAKYFLDQLDTIRKPNYKPSDQDILHSRRMTTEIQKIEFSVKVSSKYGGGHQSFWMFDVGGQRGERRKWIQVFDGISAVLFIVESSGFNTKIREDNETNRLRESLRVFQEVWSSRFLRDAGFILFLNKQDILKEKIAAGARIEDYFPEYADYRSQRTSASGRRPSSREDNFSDEYIRARCFIRDMFLSITGSKIGDKRNSSYSLLARASGGLAGNNFSSTSALLSSSINSRRTVDSGEENEDGLLTFGQKKRECFPHFTTATDTDNIKRVFDDIHTMIIMNNLKVISVT